MSNEGVSVYFTKHAIQRFRERQKVGQSIKNNKVRHRMRASLMHSCRVSPDDISGLKALANSVYLFDPERQIVYVLVQKKAVFWVVTCLPSRGRLKRSLRELVG